MNVLLRPSLYDAWHDIRSIKPKGKRAEATVLGPVCETGHTFARNRDLDLVQAGDLLAFMTAGAYGATMASTYTSGALTLAERVPGHKWHVWRDGAPIETRMQGAHTRD